MVLMLFVGAREVSWSAGERGIPSLAAEVALGHGVAGSSDDTQSDVAADGWGAPASRPDGATRLTTPPSGASDQNPAFSPDGTRLVVTRFDNGYNDGPAGLFLLDLSSGQIARLTPWEDQDNVNLPGSTWNAVLNRIIFASDRAEADDLWRIAPDGTDFSRITTHSGLPWYIEPSWSPDAQRLVFEASRPGQSEDGRVGEIWKVRADGTGLTQLTSNCPPAGGGATGGCDDRQPNWAPTGDRIVFQRRSLPSGQWDLYTMAPDGTDIRNVTNDPADDTDASWSPDGRWIVYSSDYGGLSKPNIFIIPATGGQPVRVTQSATTADGAPSWSPDGAWIAFESHTTDEAPAALWRISVPQCYDLTGDSLVTAVDIQAIAQLWGTEAGQQGFNEYWDFYYNGRIDVVDIMLVAAYWGQRCQGTGLAMVNDFLYQLQNLDLTAIRDTAYDLVVIDYSADGSAAGEFTAAQIAALKHSPGGEKIVLAYMSIGEAENYRYGYNTDDVMTPPAVTAALEGYLNVFKNAGKLVLTIDYATTPAHVDDAYARSLAKGYVPFVTVRELDQLTINSGHEPDRELV